MLRIRTSCHFRLTTKLNSCKNMNPDGGKGKLAQKLAYFQLIMYRKPEENGSVSKPIQEVSPMGLYIQPPLLLNNGLLLTARREYPPPVIFVRELAKSQL
ncbi:hypothetical protein GCK32_010624 [Trichostrongylus colubriformis]|uniref:Uncharacterized protein n=1 Tax=Trichostrongylus colubriformis TaxID=6319 RepID=A0AAN8FJS7_TRICO